MPDGMVTALAAGRPVPDTGNTAFMLVSAALVMVMTPGLAFFYGGMVRVKSVLNMLMMSFISLAVITVLWTAYGFSEAFGTDHGGVIGGADWLGMRHIGLNALWPGTGIPVYVFAAFQLMFAIITPALISGALADRVKFTAWTLYIALWATLVYFPVAHWVWGTGGWLARLGVIDFAGGTAVHINAGAAALGAVLVIRKRIGFNKDPMRPHSLPLVMLGCGLLWFGWFGFNAGSRLAADGVAGAAFVNTQVATAAAVLGWLAWERLRHGSFTTLGAASGAVAGLVAITPACGSVSPLGALALGVVTGAVCAWAVGWKFRLGFDDSLDVVGVHLVGGVVGSLAIGLLATGGVGQSAKGLFYGGGLEQLGRQCVGVVCVLVYSLVVSALLAKALDRLMGFTVEADHEVSGIDSAQHAETGYDFSGVGTAVRGALAAVATHRPAGSDTPKVDA